ncbi:MAG TPA: NHL repeat-containing protein [Solirubrobacterales bacterium]|nr:NHL repeat-containing protein [Solirubrobacterales bacterium]
MSLFVAPSAANGSPILWKTFGNFARPSGIAIDQATENVFVADGSYENTVDIYGPEGEAPTGVSSPYIFGFFFGNEPSGVAVDNSGSASAGAVYVADVLDNAVKKFELNPATETYEQVETLNATPGFSEPLGVAVNAEGNVYVADYGSSSIVIFDPSGSETGRIDVSAQGHPSSVAFDSRGDLFVQFYGSGTVYKYAANGSGEIEAGTVPTEVVGGGGSGIAVDLSNDILYVASGNHVAEYDSDSLDLLGEFGAGILENTQRVAVDPGTGRIYVSDSGKNRVFLFVPPPPPVAPTVLDESAAPSYTEAELRATIEPGNDEATYYFEYGTTSAYGSRTAAKSTDLAFEAVDVSAYAFGLSQGTTYHYRIVVSNSVETVVGPDQTFTTLTRSSALLPDDRAYELVTPPNTGGAGLSMFTAGDAFDTQLVAPDGSRLIFESQRALPGIGGNGGEDRYESIRGESGWSTEQVSPTGSEAVFPHSGGSTPDHGYSFWTSGSVGGSLDINQPGQAHYVRLPDGTFELLGRGPSGEDPQAKGRWISPGASHVIFTTFPGESVPLTADAPPSGVAAIYDRPNLGPAQLVSILPSGQTPAADAQYLGASEDGSAVVFMVEEVMYVRIDDASTLEIEAGNPTYAGISASGDRVFFLKEGNIFAFDTRTGDLTPIGTGGESTVVNVSADGSHVYFSSRQLQPPDEEGEAGARNLYVWKEGAVKYVATLSEQDFESFAGTFLVHLGQWVLAVGPEQTGQVGRADDPSRSTPNGSVFVFQSHGVAGYPYDSKGFSEIYRYSTATGNIVCLSCDPTDPPTSDAMLQTTRVTTLGAATNAISRLFNVTDDGEKVFFETGDSLVPEDTDNRSDVYEWKNGGGVWLISSGRSAGDDHLYSMTSDGHDVFFRTGDSLLPIDDVGQSIYDARVNGGFPTAAPASAPCQEACQGQGSAAPAAPAAGSSLFHGPGNRKHRHHRRKHHRHKHHRHKKQKHRQAHRIAAESNRGGVR